MHDRLKGNLTSQPAAFEVQTRARLDRLDRELRYWRLGGLLILVSAVVAIAGAMADPPAKELRVETLRIQESTGRDRLILTAQKGVPDMTFLDPEGQSRLTLDIAEDQKPVLVISESGHEKGRLTIGIENGSPMLKLYDKTGKMRVALGIPHEMGSLIRILDADGHILGRLP
jgi:hypothetical protein